MMGIMQFVHRFAFTLRHARREISKMSAIFCEVEQCLVLSRLMNNILIFCWHFQEHLFCIANRPQEHRRGVVGESTFIYNPTSSFIIFCRASSAMSPTDRQTPSVMSHCHVILFINIHLVQTVTCRTNIFYFCCCSCSSAQLTSTIVAELFQDARNLPAFCLKEQCKNVALCSCP